MRRQIFSNFDILILWNDWCLNFWCIRICWWLFNGLIDGLFWSDKLIRVEIYFSFSFNFDFLIFHWYINFAIDIFVQSDIWCIPLIIVVFIGSVSQTQVKSWLYLRLLNNWFFNLLLNYWFLFSFELLILKIKLWLVFLFYLIFWLLTFLYICHNWRHVRILILNWRSVRVILFLCLVS